jgi:hypothetical protein
MSRRKREEKIAAEVAARAVAESQPRPALSQVAASNGWTPTDNLGLTDEEVGCICRVAVGTHAVMDPNKTLRQALARLYLQTSELGPTFTYHAARLFHCYEGKINDQAFVVGNAFFDIQTVNATAASSGQVAAPEEIAAGFCTAPLPLTLPWVQLVRSIQSWFGGKNGLGYPDLDERYTVWGGNKDLARRIIGPEIASLVASRDDWGVLVNQTTLALVTANPLSTGVDAQELVTAATHVVGLIPSDPMSLR